MTINETGNVCIGTTDASAARLVVAGGSNVDNLLVYGANDAQVMIRGNGTG